MQRPGLLALGATLLLQACSAETPPSPSAPSARWTPRFDEDPAPDEAKAEAKAEAKDGARFLEVGGHVEVKPGPNATLWHPSHQANGTYRLSADVTHLDSGLHPHGAGLTFGGTDVHGPYQTYGYFLVRCDGMYLIKKRYGEATEEVVPWTEHEAVSPEDDKGVTRNRLTVEVGAKDTRFLVNGTEVHRAPNAGLPTAGRYGFRLVHDLHVRFGAPQLEAVTQ